MLTRSGGPTGAVEDVDAILVRSRCAGRIAVVGETRGERRFANIRWHDLIPENLAVISADANEMPLQVVRIARHFTA